MLYRSRPAPECGERSYSVFRCRRRTGEDGAQRWQLTGDCPYSSSRGKWDIFTPRNIKIQKIIYPMKTIKS